MRDALEEAQAAEAELHAELVSNILTHITNVIAGADIDEEGRANVYEDLSDELAGRANQIRGW